MLFSFQRTDGEFVIGKRTAVETVVRDELINLWRFPFIYAEAARFIGDQEAILKAEKATARLLKNPRSERKELGPFVAGESNRKDLQLDEKNHVEEPLLEHLAKLDWTVLRLEMHSQTAAETGRRDFSQVVLEKRLTDAIVRINDWIEPDQVEEVVRRLCDFQSPSLIESNKQVLTWITEGIGVAENRKAGEPSPTVRIVDFSPNSTKNDWLAVSQLKVKIPGRDQHIIPDVVLFLNGLPIVVIECKSPKVEEPIAEAIDQLLRYSEQRGATGEGNAALFFYNQFVVATCREQAKFGTITTHTERHFYRWSDPWPFSLDEVAEQTAKEGSAGSPCDQARLTAGMCAHKNLLSLLQSFTLFTTDARGRTRKVVARYQQFRAVHKVLERMTNGETPAQRGGIVWHTQGSGKSLTMVFVVRELRRRNALLDWKVVFVTDRTQLEEQLSETSQSIGQTVVAAENISHLKELIRDPSSNCVMAMVQKFQERDLKAIFPVLNASPKILIMIDEAHRTQYGLLKANLERAMPNATNVAYTGTPIEKTERTFGAYIDYYTMRQAQEDGVTLEIVYEGRTHSASVSDAKAMDAKFQDVFSEYRLDERLQILGHGTRDAYLDAKTTIEAKARDMVRHFARQVFPGGYKAQVVANSRIAAVRYAEALREAIAEEVKSLAEDNPLQVNADELNAVEVALVITWGNNDEAEIKDAMRNVDIEKSVKRFKMPFEAEENSGGETLNGRIGIVVVTEMLVTGFDAPVEQVLYLDRVIKDHGLLQAIARVNRVYDEGKDCGFVVDYVGVGNNLRKALDAYAQKEQQEVIECLTPASELIGDLKQALDETLEILARNGLSDTTETEAFYDLFYDEDIRFEYLTAFRKLTHAFNKALPRAEALDYFHTYQRLGAVNELASQFLKDDRLSMKGVPKKLRAITDEFLESQGIEQKVAPISVFDPEFQKQAAQRNRSKTKAAEVEHAVRHHIEVNYDEDPELFASFAQELERILQEFAGNWDAIWKEMEKLRQKLMAKEQEETHGLDRKRGMRIFRIIKAELFGETPPDEEQIAKLVNLTQLVFQTVQTEVRQAGFWGAPAKQARLKGELQKILIGEDFVNFGPMWDKKATIISRIMEWARLNHKLVIRP
ncbi:type I restriction endonuclease subunit R [Coraliomargarita parva]|uniref:type I restriction endonuclease subunit R n=1 Tax=Coraliomargarita parva TaxID=3014050 RepID=UPI0022B4D0D4|nr:type I restriction endonuclease subunit R [Coraliomargarita parva]